ncbi:MAG TPA: hypothetical protein VGR57_00945, partial [Ktedonobacterales bacterium]|nr:hypothetical protein [Ktedonobacterales bacterium]
EAMAAYPKRWEAPRVSINPPIGRNDANPPIASAPASTPARCDICEARTGRDVAFLDETGDVPEPRRSWMLCPDCNAAVSAELARSPVATRLRVRVAVGMVAAERSPHAVRKVRTGFGEDAWLPFLFWGFGIAMVLHLIVIALIALH